MTRNLLQLKIAAAVVIFAAGNVYGVAGSVAGYRDRLAFVEKSGVETVFSEVAVKANRPMPWEVFVSHRYRLFKDGGDVKDGDLGKKPHAAVWLAILDEDYRKNGKLIFVRGGKVPGVKEDGWISLNDFEHEIMPRVVFSRTAFEDEKTAAAVRELVERATALHELSWDDLLVIPPSRGRAWGPAAHNPEALRYAAKLTEAYKKRDAAALRIAAEEFARFLVTQRNYPPRSKIKLELFAERWGILKIAFGLYLLSSLIFFVWGAFRKRFLATAGFGIGAAGFVSATIGLVIRAVVAGYLPTTGMYEYLIVLSWAAALFFIVFYVATRHAALGLIVMPVSFLAMVLASLFPSEIEGQLIPALQSWWLTIHVSLAALGEGAFAVAFAAAVFRLLRSDRPNNILPSKDTLAVLEYRAIAVGFPLFTIGGLVAGAIWAQKAWSAWWSWDPKETASLVVFLVAAAYLHARRLAGWQGAKSAILAILIFVSAVLTLFANLIFGGLHAYGI